MTDVNAYAVNLDHLAKRAKMMRASAKRVLAPEQRQGMVSGAEKYEAFVRAARAGSIATTYESAAAYQDALRRFVGDTRISMEDRTTTDWNGLRDNSIEAILNDTVNVRDYDPDALERLSQEPRLAGKPTGKAWALLAQEMRAGRVPTRLPKGRALELARLLVHQQRWEPTSEQVVAEPVAIEHVPFWRRWLKSDNA